MSWTRKVTLGLAIGCGVVAADRGAVAAQTAAGAQRFVVAPDGNEARYRVKEQLAGFDFPNDAVGKTTNVTGRLALDAKGAVIAGESEFVIDVSTLQSDQDRRDNYVRRNTLATETYPRAVFRVTGAKGLPSPLPKSGEVTFQLVGDLTLKDATRPVTWDVTARFENGVVAGKAQTKFTFTDFGMTKPRVARVLSVDDEIRLEYDFKLVPST